MKRIFIQFEAGESRYTESGAVNFMIAQPDSDVDLYAEIAVPDGVSDDYGYLSLKSAILEQANDMGIPADALEFWYDGQEDHLEPDAAASDGIRSAADLITKTDNLVESECWYAVMKDADDTDWGTGSHDRAEAIQKARDLRDCGYDDAYVAIISDGPDPVCIGELHDLDD